MEALLLDIPDGMEFKCAVWKKLGPCKYGKSPLEIADGYKPLFDKYGNKNVIYGPVMVKKKNSIKTIKVSDIEVSIVEGRVYIDMPKYMPVVISAEDKFRKGILVGICPKCGEFKNLSCSNNNLDFCSDCTLIMDAIEAVKEIKKKKKKTTKK